MKPILAFFTLALFVVNPASAQRMHRLAAQARYESDRSTGALRLTDTAHYRYSGDRGSRFDVNGLRYTDLATIGTAPVADYINQELASNNIDSSYLPLTDFDTASFFLHIGLSLPAPQNSFEGRTYTASGGISQVNSEVFDVASGTQAYGQRSINVYTGGLLTRVYVTTYNAGVYDTAFIRDLSYDGAGRLLMDSLSVRLAPNSYLGYRRTVYTYGSGAGYLTAVRSAYRPSPPGLVAVSRTTNTYYPDGRVRTRFYEGNISGGPFTAAGLDSFGYTPGVAGHTYLREQTFNASGAAEYAFYTLAVRINAAGRKDSVVSTFYQRNTLQGISSAAIIYNADGLPERRLDYELSTATMLPRLYSAERYYYEGYGTAAGVAGVAEKGIYVYPNPTSGTVWLAGPDGMEAGPLEVRVSDALGRPVRVVTETSSGGGPLRISLGEAAPGLYYLTVSGTGGGPIYRTALLKQ